MEENKQVTPLEGIELAVNQLNSISVPIILTEQVAIPLARSIDLIKKCIPFLVEKIPEETKKEEAPEIEILNADEDPDIESGVDTDE